MFNSLLLVVAYAAVAFGASLPAVPKLDGRIVGGTDATIEEAPYQISALLDGSRTGAFYHACGGSIISRKHILTAAHCTDGTRASHWRVRVGSSYSDIGGKIIRVGAIIQHSEFNSETLDNDISILRLSVHLKLGPKVAIVSLPNQGDSVADGANAFVTGWGATEEGGDISNVLQKLTVPIVNQDDCAEAYEGGITENMLCAGIPEGGKDSCQGDSGGPLTVGGILHGITSWGNGCARPAYPGIYTRVANYIDWIDSRT